MKRINLLLLLSSLVIFGFSAQAQTKDAVSRQIRMYNSSAVHLLKSLEQSVNAEVVSSQICSGNAGDEEMAAIDLVGAFNEDVIIPEQLKKNFTLTSKISCLGKSENGLVKVLTDVCEEVRSKGGEWAITPTQKQTLQQATQSALDCTSFE